MEALKYLWRYDDFFNRFELLWSDSNRHPVAGDFIRASLYSSELSGLYFAVSDPDTWNIIYQTEIFSSPTIVDFVLSRDFPNGISVSLNEGRNSWPAQRYSGDVFWESPIRAIRTLVPFAVSSQLDQHGKERLHISNTDILVKGEMEG